MLTYRAVIQAGDTRRALDAVTSLSRYGDWLMDEANWVKPALRIREADDLPLGEYDVDEKLNIQLALPLLRIAEILPLLGNIHTVWLFNVFVCALNVGLIYLILRALHFDDLVSVVVAITAGLGTNLWAYSQTFFREPLTSCFILFALLMLQLARERSRLHFLAFLALAVAGYLLALETKYSALLALPALVIFGLPAIPRVRVESQRLLAAALLAASLLLLLLLMLIDPLPWVVQEQLGQFGYRSEYIGEALRTYVLSPGASLWGTSPIVLLALVGGIILWQRAQYRLLLIACIFFITYPIGLAISTGPHWFGGLSWPPRFLLPVLPALMLLTAPVAEMILSRPHRVLRIVWLILLAYGIWIQFAAVSISWNHYSDSLPPESSGLAEWTPSLIQPQYFRWVVLPQRWNDLGLDFLWTRAQLPTWGVSFITLVAVLSIALAQLVRNRRSRWRFAAPPLAVLCLSLILLNLTSAHFKDPRTQSQKRALHEVLENLSQHAEADDVLLLTSNDYGEFVLNHWNGDLPRPIVLPRPLAQAASDRQPAQVLSDNPNDWFDVRSYRVIQHLARHHDRLWVLDNTSPFMTWSYRPLERYLAQQYFPLRTVSLQQNDDTVRLMEYSTVNAAPQALGRFSGDTPVGLRYGDYIHLRSLFLPSGESYKPGDVIELSLLWQTEARLAVNYTVAWFIAGADADQPHAQGQDSGPQDGFAPTSAWKPNDLVWDNRALRLPGTTPPGDYQIWVLMYQFNNATGEILRLPVSGARVMEGGTVGVLPVTLTVD